MLRECTDRHRRNLLVKCSDEAGGDIHIRVCSVAAEKRSLIASGKRKIYLQQETDSWKQLRLISRRIIKWVEGSRVKAVDEEELPCLVC